MEKDKYKRSYNVVRILGTPLFKYKFKPQIIGQNNIPKDGPVIFAGSHHHALDQFPVICATNKITHWCAKAEYFNEERNSMLGILCRMTGAIPVHRGKDTTLVKTMSIDYLNIGSSIGIFPEGTRNGLKKDKIEEIYNNNNIDMDKDNFINAMFEQKPLLSQIEFLEELKKEQRITIDEYHNALLQCKESLLNFEKNNIISSKEYDNSLLLPFNFGAVSFAAKTGVPIIPFSVNGDFKKGNDNLIVQFGQPLYCDNNNLESDNNNLRKEVLQLEKNYLNNPKKLILK